MIRVSYSRNDDGNLVSNLFPLHSEMSFVLIDVQNKTYQIRSISEDNTVKLVSEGSGKDLTDCKRKIRKQLEEVGVIFKDEIRNKI